MWAGKVRANLCRELKWWTQDQTWAKAQGIALLRARVSSLLQECGVTATSMFGGAVAGCAVNVTKYHILPAGNDSCPGPWEFCNFPRLFTALNGQQWSLGLTQEKEMWLNHKRPQRKNQFKVTTVLGAISYGNRMYSTTADPALWLEREISSSFPGAAIINYHELGGFI